MNSKKYMSYQAVGYMRAYHILCIT